MAILPKKPVKKMLERDVKKQIMIATSDRCVWFNNPVGMAYSANGTPIKYGCGGTGASDLLGIGRGSKEANPIAGRFIACETKRPKGGKYTKEQLRFMEMIRMHGGIAFGACSVEEANHALDWYIRGGKFHVPMRLTDVAKPFFFPHHGTIDGLPVKAGDKLTFSDGKLFINGTLAKGK